MDFIQTANKQVDKFGAGKHGFSAGNPSGGVPATYVSPTWCDNIQQEIVNVIEGSGLVVNPGSQTQLFQAIQAIYAASSGNDYKASVRFTTTGNIVLNGLGTQAGGDWPAALNAGDRVLAKDQAVGNQNGFYVAAAGAWVRATDADQAGELSSGASVEVEEGVSLADSRWVLITDGAITIGTTALQFARKDAGAIGGAIQGAFKNLQASATGLNANVAVTVDEVSVENASGVYQTLRGVNLAINTATAGANGLDTGALAASTCYYLWLIWNGATVAGLISLSSTAPTMPAGYTHKARVGSIRTDGTANKYPFGFKQYGCDFQYVVAAGSNMAALPIAISGVQGSTTVPTWVSASLSSFVPATAAKVKFSLGSLGAGGVSTIAAPNNGYGGRGSTTNPPPAIVSSASGAQANQLLGEFVLETANVYFASDGSGAFSVMGWTDNL